MPTFSLALRNAELDAHNAKVLLEFSREVDPPRAERGKVLSRLGDEKQLRGVPVVGAKGVGGAIDGSRPGQGFSRENSRNG